MAASNNQKLNLRLVMGPADAEPALACVEAVTELGFDSMTVYMTASETEVYEAIKPYAHILEKGADLKAKECGREDIPKVAYVDSLASAITRDGKPDACIVFWENANDYNPIREGVETAVRAYRESGSSNPFNCTVVVGPASGIGDFDIDVIKSVCPNAVFGSLSRIVAGVQTAAIAGCAIANFEVNAAFEAETR
jgi:16S rRNA U1498 N3-methylase RsmE